MSATNKTRFSTVAGDGYVEADRFDTPSGSRYRIEKIAKVAIAAIDTSGGLFSWANPESSSIIVNGIYLNVTTKATAACTVDIGTTAATAVTATDNMIDGVDVGTAAGLFSNFDDAGTNGKKDQLLATGKWVTGSVASGASAGIVGYVYIRYFEI